MESLSVKFLGAVVIPALFAAVAWAQVEYRFNDSPRSDADVVVASYRLETNGSELWLVGRLFNRGLKTARNVRIVPNLYSKDGVALPATIINLRPADIPPTSFADFSDRVLMSGDRDIVARPAAEWSN